MVKTSKYLYQILIIAIVIANGFLFSACTPELIRDLIESSNTSGSISSSVTTSGITYTPVTQNCMNGFTNHPTINGLSYLNMSCLTNSIAETVESIVAVTSVTGVSVCWVGTSADLTKGKSVWCRKNGVNTEITDTYISAATEVIEHNSKIYFVAMKSGIGRKIFIYDGISINAAGEVNIGSDDNPSALTSAGTNLYFKGTIGGVTKLFKWNGVAVTQVSDTNPGLNDDPYSLTPIGNNIAFVATDGMINGGYFLYYYDGTNTNMTGMTNAAMSWPGDFPYGMVYDGQFLFYAAQSMLTFGPNVNYTKVFKFDPATYINVQYGEYNIGDSDTPNNLVMGSDDHLYFLSTGNNYIYNYTFNRIPTSSTVITQFKKIGESFYYFGYPDPTDGISRLYGYNYITNTLTTIASGYTGTNLTVSGTKLYFTRTIAASTNLYFYDTTTPSVAPQMLPDVFSGGDDSPSVLTPAAGGGIYFSAETSYGTRLFYYDGSSTMSQISNVGAGVASAARTVSQVWKNALGVFFTFTNAGNTKLFKLSAGSAVQVSNTNPTGNDSPNNLYTDGVKLYFTANNSSGFQKVYIYDGTSTTQISDVNPGGSDNLMGVTGTGDYMVFAGGNMYFTSTTTGGTYKYNGSTVTNIFNGIYYFDKIGSDLYYLGNNLADLVLYKFDGTSSTQLHNFGSNANTSIVMYPAAYSNSEILFSLADTTPNTKLYSYHTTNGVTQISDINPGGNDDISYGLTVAGLVAFFQAMDMFNTNSLYKYNGVATTLASDTWNFGDDWPMNYSVQGSNLYYGSYDSGIGGYRLYKHDGTNSTPLVSYAGATTLTSMTENGSDLFYIKLDAGGVNTLRKYNGAVETQPFDIISGQDNGVGSLVKSGTDFYFSAKDPTATTQLLYKYTP